ncbi:glutamate-1-semialdehyde 2,1-aminomutase [Ferroacidibacillus organovorans]|uniref:Glutamate-1-semialdehyde 2,1-aminomutase n=1 Tax=Ferroacidibacillus organovorans TaxID=1765683 RepID=A0A162T900_9BACL|nr:glutamate-1-semialdehyde 2,1-aminomutase [Ferroacidibacillus organovorans]KYP80577.1 glutamate-1-semialdehyde aminotransferase [Ferroacidibacillus organovorans]OAG93453.1 glutamate-1-semialdehyde aminotransferase [Ferroacidibacillus organovorans]OPG17078.1 aspartate aminotransferase family protein [Ferroacidibacillus organovorans]
MNVKRSISQSESWYERAKESILGGVNSPARSFKSVGGHTPVTMARAQGAYLYDVDGNRYIDYVCAYGPIITGHAHPAIAEAVANASREGYLFGTPSVWEPLYAERLKAAIPELERVRMVNSGTEAVMTTLRVARAYTKRSRIIKFAGCYHGHSDAVLVAAGSGPSSVGVPDSAGVPASTAQEVITVPFNDVASLRQAASHYGEEIAAILIEPVVGNFGIVTPHPGYLAEVRRVANELGAVLIYDEVITGFRFRYGAVEFDDVKPDLYAFGKIIGGGLPIGAYGGRREIMEQVSPLGPAYQAGTMAGNAISLRAGLACLQLLSDTTIYERMETLAKRLESGLLARARAHGVAVTVNRYKTAFTLFFGPEKIENYAQAMDTNSQQFSAFFHHLLEHGVHLAPSKYEAWFLTTEHTEAMIDETLAIADSAFAAIRP